MTVKEEVALSTHIEQLVDEALLKKTGPSYEEMAKITNKVLGLHDDGTCGSDCPICHGGGGCGPVCLCGCGPACWHKGG